MLEDIGTAVAAGLGGYLCGSIPFGLITARLVAGVDLRTVASGNIGATNVARVCGWRWALLVLCLDALKGAVPTYVLPRLLAPAPAGSTQSGLLFRDLMVLVGLAAILGHMFPVWLKFKGGKGGATGLGVGAVLAPKAVIVAACAYVVVVGVTRYSSLGTLTGTFAYVATYLFTVPDPFGRTHRTVTAFILVAAALIVFRHRANIQRLLRGQEHRLDFSRRRKNDGSPAARPESGGPPANREQTPPADGQ